MDISQLLTLYTLVDKHKNQLKAGKNKLSLEAGLLSKLNYMCNCRENVSHNEEHKDSIRDLFNLIACIPKLHVSQRSIDSNVNLLDITIFKTLKFLSLEKISVDRINGLNLVKSKLEVFICIRCLRELNLFCDGVIWRDLKVLSLTYGKLEMIERNLFKNTPFIQHLDLSCNCLQNVDGLDMLEHLKYLDLSFNHVQTLPTLGRKGYKNLQILLLSFNQLQSLSGVNLFSNLRGLDVSFNCILDQGGIKDLFPLKLLQWVNLGNNPLSFNPQYRLNVVYNIGTQVAPHQFVLDNIALNSIEKNFLGIYSKVAGNVKTAENNPLGEGTSNITGREIRRRTAAKLSLSKINKVREVIIEEVPDEDDLSNEVSNEPLNDDPVIEEHLETKKQVEILRQKFGKDNWLHSHAGVYVQDLMGLKKNDVSSPYNISHYDIVTKASLMFNQGMDTSPGTSVKAIVHNKANEASTLQKENNNITQILNPSSGESKKITALTNLKRKNENSSEEENSFLVFDNKQDSEEVEIKNDVNGDIKEIEETLVEDMTINSDSIETENENSEIMSSTPPSEDQFASALEDFKELDDIEERENDHDEFLADEKLWIVTKVVDFSTFKTEALFLVLSDTELKEKSTSSGCTITKWSLDSVQSCVKVKSDPITVELEFDTPRRDKQSRVYIMEFADAQILINKLTVLLESRPLSAMNQGTYKCMKCSSIFTHFTPTLMNLKSKNAVISCQICASTYVIEMEEPRLPVNKIMQEKSMSHSPSDSSIGSAASLDQSVKSVKGSAEINTPRRYESDVEIISNPSQSSIEVLDEPRKRLSEERQTIAAVPQLVTVPEILVSCPALTESSSSGSLSESVVTAYESHSAISKKIMSEDSVLEEMTEESPTNNDKLNINIVNINTPEIENKTQTETHTEDSFHSITSQDENKNAKIHDIYNYTDFSIVDHRILAFLYQCVFENDDEKCLGLAKCHLWKTGGIDFDGCLVFSSKTLYLLELTSSLYGDDASEWLKNIASYRISDIKLVFPLIWFQGLGLQIKNLYYLALFQNKKRTENFMSFLSGLSLKVKIQKTPNSKTELLLQELALSNQLDQKSDDPTVNLFTICSKLSIFKDDVCEDTMRLVGVVVTGSELHVVLGDLGWLMGSSSGTPQVHTTQLISSLIEAEQSDMNLILHFLNEAEGVEEVWSLNLSTNDEVATVIKALQAPCELLFSTPLNVIEK